MGFKFEGLGFSVHALRDAVRGRLHRAREQLLRAALRCAVGGRGADEMDELVAMVESLEARAEALRGRVAENEAEIALLTEARDRAGTRSGQRAGPIDLEREKGAQKPATFVPFASRPEASFFRALGEKKLGELMLDAGDVRAWGVYAPGGTGSGAWLETRDSSFASSWADAAKDALAFECVARGTLRVVNTLEDFKAADKARMLADAAGDMVRAVHSGEALARPAETLARFVGIAHADLKSHKFVYWFAFPSIPFEGQPPLLAKPPVLVESRGVLRAIARHLASPSGRDGFFLVELPSPSVVVSADDVALSGATEGARCAPLSVYASLTPAQRQRVVLGCVDPSTDPDHPGWPVRNLLALACVLNADSVEKAIPLILVRDRITEPGLALNKPFPNTKVWTFLTTQTRVSTQPPPPHQSGVWEPNANGKMGPRLLDLGATLDPKRLAEQASDLNVRLMKWRALPELDQNTLRRTSVLLVGAGTLGCAVARVLVGWGFRRITFVDNARVSYSNPPRQSLFTVADCEGTGKFKAERAAEALRDVHPSVVTAGVRLNVPMPGHPDLSEGGAASREDFARLNQLVQDHDVVVMLTDTRESRWLPTLLGVAHDKLTLNAALGFDNYLVMRHGGGSDAAFADGDANKRPGCYFCIDLFAPRDSTKNRAMDQQCTVTRPGAAPMAGAVLVELLVGLLHHPLRQRAPADVRGASSSAPGDARGGGVGKLGLLPHQVRGYLPTFSQELVSVSAFPQCTACSRRVVEAFRRDGYDLVRRAMDAPEILEELTGLAELQRRAADAAADEDFAMSESGGDDDGDDDDDGEFDAAGDDE